MLQNYPDFDDSTLTYWFVIILLYTTKVTTSRELPFLRFFRCRLINLPALRRLSTDDSSNLRLTLLRDIDYFSTAYSRLPEDRNIFSRICLCDLFVSGLMII